LIKTRNLNLAKGENMKDIKFNTKKNNNQLIVEVELPERRYVKDPVINFSNSDLLTYLESTGVKLNDYELASTTNQNLTSYSNKVQEPVLTGTWTFDKIEVKKEEKKVNKKNTRTYNKKARENPTGD